jgi:ADP-ribose pyrophosphatase
MLANSPDPQSFADLERIMQTYEQGGIRIDGASGEPLNPKGRTGISGRGALWLWGPNHAADFLLTRYNQDTKSLEALLIQRQSGQWAIPGGMIDREESTAQAAMRELKEEANIIAHATSRTWELYRGYVDDPRNTDNAWMETSVFHEHLGTVTPNTDMQPSAGDDAKAAAWVQLTPELIRNLYASHPAFVEMGLEALVAAPGTDSNVRAAAAQLLDL